MSGMSIQITPVHGRETLCGVPPLPCAINIHSRKRKRSLSPPSSKINTRFYHAVHTVQLQLNDGHIPSDLSSPSTLPDDQEHLKSNPDYHAQHADPPIQHSYDTQSLDNLCLHQMGAGGGESKSLLSIHPESPYEVRRRSKVSRHMYNIGPRRDQAMSKPPVSHLPPHRAPPVLGTLGPPPPAPPSPPLRPLPTMAFATTPHLPISLNARPSSSQDQQLHRLTGDIDYNPRDEATGADVPTNSKTRKCFRAAQGPVDWDASSYRTLLPPSQLEVNNEMDCDNGCKHRAAHSITPLLPWQAVCVFAAAFESWHKSPPVPCLSREPPDTHQVLQENPSLLPKEYRTEARLARSSLPLSVVSSLSSGSKPYISSESQVAGSLGKCTSSPSRVELKDKSDHRSTVDVPIEPEKHSCKRAISQILENSDSTFSDSSLSSPPFPAPPATSPPPTRRRRPRKKPLSTHEGRPLLSSVVRRRREGVAAKPTLDTSKSTNTAPSLVGVSQQAKREVSRAYFDCGQTPRGSEYLASIFDGDLSDLEEDQVPLSGAVPNNACSRPPKAVSSTRLNMMWRTVAPVKVPQRHRERLAVTLKGIESGGYGTFRTTHDNTARNAVLARAKKVEQGGISGVVSDPNVSVRSHGGQDIADAEIGRMLALLTLIRSPPEK